MLTLVVLISNLIAFKDTLSDRKEESYEREIRKLS